MKYSQYALIAIGVLVLMVGLGFSFQVNFLLATWPWPDGRLSYLFIGSIFAAASAAMLWIGWTGEWGALPAGSLNLMVMGTGFACYFFYLSLNGRPEMLPYTFGWVLMVIFGTLAFRSSQKIALIDQRPTPKLVQLSFGLFITALLLAGGAMILRIPIFPWPLNPDSSVIFGCIFLGDAFYFIYGLWKPSWPNAAGQLLSFLFYDLVLIGPFLNLFTTIKPELMLSLTVYTAVLVYSGAIAIYYLFIHQPTRLIQL